MEASPWETRGTPLTPRGTAAPKYDRIVAVTSGRWVKPVWWVEPE